MAPTSAGRDPSDAAESESTGAGEGTSKEVWAAVVGTLAATAGWIGTADSTGAAATGGPLCVDAGAIAVNWDALPVNQSAYHPLQLSGLKTNKCTC